MRKFLEKVIFVGGYFGDEMQKETNCAKEVLEEKFFRYIRNICPHDKIYIRQNKSNSYQSDGICIGQICRQGLRINLHLCQDKSVIFCGQIVLMMRMAMQMLGYGNVSCVARRLQHYCGYITPTTPCIILQWIFLDGVESYC